VEPPRYDHRRLERLLLAFRYLARFAPNEELPLNSGPNHRKLVKDPENDLSQLNRLDGPTFFLLTSDFSRLTQRCFLTKASAPKLSPNF
jgi:hypothetical protein